MWPGRGRYKGQARDEIFVGGGRKDAVGQGEAEGAERAKSVQQRADELETVFAKTLKANKISHICDGWQCSLRPTKRSSHLSERES